MNQDSIKELLLKLKDTDTDFTVTFTGKASNRVNGLYKPATHEILLHNKNFKSDNQLIYTAIHEYAHHLQWEREEKKSTPHPKRCHNTDFWSLMYDLLDIAVEKNLYHRTRSEQLRSLIQEAHRLDVQIAKMQQELGLLLNNINDVCQMEGLRYDDVIVHDLQMQRSSAKKSVAASRLGMEELGQDALNLILTAKPNTRANLEKQINSGKSIEQIKKTVSKPVPDNLSESKKLEKEKHRLETTIQALTTRLETVINLIDRQNKKEAC